MYTNIIMYLKLKCLLLTCKVIHTFFYARQTIEHVFLVSGMHACAEIFILGEITCEYVQWCPSIPQHSSHVPQHSQPHAHIHVIYACIYQRDVYLQTVAADFHGGGHVAFSVISVSTRCRRLPRPSWPALERPSPRRIVWWKSSCTSSCWRPQCTCVV
jgi:hypothetical protein